MPDSPRQAAAKLKHRLGVTRAVRFMESALVEVPTVVGALRPMVLLPAATVSGLSIAQVEMILAHELAHVRRHDYLVNLSQTVIEALLFFHPAVWWVSAQVRRERENCCDDIAVAVSGNREHYVQALTRLEEQRAASSVAVLAATGGSLLERVRRLLGQPGAEFGYRSVSAWLAGLVAVGVVTLALATADATREKAGNGSADEVGQEDATPAPIEHEAVMVVRELLKVMASGDFDRAVGLAVRGEFKREGLAEVAKSFDLTKADIAEALVGGANAAVLTNRIPARGEAKPGQFGFDLVSEHDRWLIRDVDFFPDDQAVEKWLADFRELEPGARPAGAGPRAGEQPSDREAMLAHARALAVRESMQLHPEVVNAWRNAESENLIGLSRSDLMEKFGQPLIWNGEPFDKFADKADLEKRFPEKLKTRQVWGFQFRNVKPDASLIIRLWVDDDKAFDAYWSQPGSENMAFFNPPEVEMHSKRSV